MPRYCIIVSLLIFFVSSCSIPDLEEPDIFKEAENEGILLSSLQRKFMYGMFYLYVDKSGNPYTGWAKEWNQEELQTYLGYLKDGRKEGTWISRDENGTTRTKIGWTEDRMEGIFKIWHANGQIKVDGKTHDGEVDGEWREFYSTGQLACNSINNNGHLISIRVWNPDGTRCSLSQVTDGNGTFFSYLENGQPVHKRIFSEGVETSREIFNQR